MISDSTFSERILGGIDCYVDIRENVIVNISNGEKVILKGGVFL